MPQPFQFILAWDRLRNMLDCIPPWLVQEEKLVIIGIGFYRPDDLPVTQPNQECQSTEGNKTVMTTTREDDALTACPFLIQHRTLDGRGVGSLTASWLCHVPCVDIHVRQCEAQFHAHGLAVIVSRVWLMVVWCVCQGRGSRGERWSDEDEFVDCGVCRAWSTYLRLELDRRRPGM